MVVSGQHHVPVALPETVFHCLLLGRPQRLSGHYEDKINLLPLAGIEPRFLGRSAHIVFSIPMILKVNRANMGPPYCYVTRYISMAIVNVPFSKA
jgi:hypothetical protein